MSAVDDLALVATRHGTDKWNRHWYAKPYAIHLSHLRDQPFTLLEIGVGGYDDPNEGGQSLRAWKEFFPRAKIIGLDIHPKANLEQDRIRIYQGSQVDPMVIARIISDNAEGLEVIIDDGSHRSEHVIASFMMLWPLVKDGGWYIVEDLQTSYWPNFGGRLNDRDSSLTSMGFFKSLIDGLNWREIHQPHYEPSLFDRSIFSIHFYHNMCFLNKGSNVAESTVVVNNRVPGV